MTAAAVHRWQRECERSGGDCASRVEAVALRQPWARALREGPLLRVFTLEREIKLYDGADPGRAAYRYLGLMLPESLHLIWQRTAGRSELLAISDLDGQMRQAPATLTAKLSPREMARDEATQLR